jgi:hypothetical protein
VILGHYPAGTSTRNMEHWIQAYNGGKFQAFNYGYAWDNVAHYGSPFPPVWDLKNIRVPVHLFAGKSDEMADPTDVNTFWDSLKP